MRINANFWPQPRYGPFPPHAIVVKPPLLDKVCLWDDNIQLPNTHLSLRPVANAIPIHVYCILCTKLNR